MPWTFSNKVQLTLYHTIPTFNYPFENIKGKGESDGNHFLLFPQCFLPYQRNIAQFKPHVNCHLQILSIWTSVKFLHLVRVKHFPHYQTTNLAQTCTNCKQIAGNTFNPFPNIQF